MSDTATLSVRLPATVKQRLESMASSRFQTVKAVLVDLIVQAHAADNPTPSPAKPAAVGAASKPKSNVRMLDDRRWQRVKGSLWANHPGLIGYEHLTWVPMVWSEPRTMTVPGTSLTQTSPGAWGLNSELFEFDLEYCEQMAERLDAGEGEPV